MKKALMLAGLVLCVSSVYAAETRTDQVKEGQKRNEDAYERILEQTGWKREKVAREDKPASSNTRGPLQRSSPSKSS